jgi:hypothetical protein
MLDIREFLKLIFLLMLVHRRPPALTMANSMKFVQKGFRNFAKTEIRKIVAEFGALILLFLLKFANSLKLLLNFNYFKNRKRQL